MNFAMWKKALTVIPNVTKEEWDKLDIISKWLISTRAAVLLMTLLSAVLAGLFAWHDGYKVNILAWFILALGLVLAHASNNIFNDYTDYTRGVDKDNYYRTMYGPQPVADGLMTKRQHLTYFAVTAFLALLCGLYLIFFARQRSNHLDLAWTGGFLRLVLHLAAEIHCDGRNRRVDRLGPVDDRRRLLRFDWRMELECGLGQPAVCAGRNDRYLWQAY
jgi:hypothetical protein